MKLSNPIKLKNGLEIVDIHVYHTSDVEEETFNYVDEEDDPLYDDTELCVTCSDFVSMIIKDESFKNLIFKCKCNRHLDPVEFHEYLMRDFSEIDVVDFCIDFVRKFGDMSDFETCDTLDYENEERHSGWERVNLNEPLRSAKISSVDFHYVNGWMDIIVINFSDNDSICIHFKISEQRRSINFFTFIEKILYNLGSRVSTGKEELFKQLTDDFGFVIDVVDVQGKYIVQSYLSMVAENLSIFHVKQENKPHTKFIPMYLNTPVADISSISVSLDDMKIFQDANMVFDL